MSKANSQRELDPLKRACGQIKFLMRGDNRDAAVAQMIRYQRLHQSDGSLVERSKHFVQYPERGACYAKSSQSQPSSLSFRQEPRRQTLAASQANLLQDLFRPWQRNLNAAQTARTAEIFNRS